MVVDNPLSDGQMDALEQVTEEQFSGEVTIEEVSTAGNDYSYTATCRQTTNKPSMREVVLKIVWHDDESDWEITDYEAGAWRS